MDFILLLVGFVLLIKGADFFVDASSNIAKKLRVPSLIIGLTIVALGTSAPEAAVSITAAITGSNSIALGNIVGSNMFNLFVVVGACAAIAPIAVKTSLLKKEFPFSILAAFLLLVMSCDTFFGNGEINTISRSEGLTLLVFFVIFMYSLITFALSNRTELGSAESEKERKKISVLKNFLIVVVSAIVIVVGGDFVVDSATNIALRFGMSETLVGLTIVALGTSLPELVTSIVASKKGENDLALGNVIGSNIFNILFVLGSATAISPIVVEQNIVIDTTLLIVMSIVAYVFAISGKKVNRPEGIVMLLMYFGYLAYIIMR